MKEILKEENTILNAKEKFLKNQLFNNIDIVLKHFRFMIKYNFPGE